MDDNTRTILEEMMRKVRELLPEAQVELDNDGQLIIYTNIFEEICNG